MFASAMMLHHLRLHGFADRVDKAVTSVIEVCVLEPSCNVVPILINAVSNVQDGVALTKDLGGSSTTEEFTEAVIDRL